MKRYYLVVFLSFFSCSSFLEARYVSEKIVGGEPARTGRFKYQVSVQGDKELDCGGGILGELHVLTAAHCVIDEKNRFYDFDLTVVAGTIDAKASTEAAIRIRVKKAYVPSTYKRGPPDQLDNHDHEDGDIAVLMLTKNLNLNRHPALGKLELPKLAKAYPSYEEKEAVIAGYGYQGVKLVLNPKTNEMVEVPTINNSKLRWAEAKVFLIEMCSEIYQETFSDHQLCAQVKQRNPKVPEGICTGDSGSPLVIKENIVIGVVDTSPELCDESRVPGIYTRVTSYLEFIHDAMDDTNTSKIRYKIY